MGLYTDKSGVPAFNQQAWSPAVWDSSSSVVGLLMPAALVGRAEASPCVFVPI